MQNTFVLAFWTLQLLLLVLRADGKTTLPWAAVLAPTWVRAGVSLVVGVLALVAG